MTTIIKLSNQQYQIIAEFKSLELGNTNTMTNASVNKRLICY